MLFGARTGPPLRRGATEKEGKAPHGDGWLQRKILTLWNSCIWEMVRDLLKALRVYARAGRKSGLGSVYKTITLTQVRLAPC